MLSHLSRYLQRECPITNVDFNTLDEQGVVVVGGKATHDFGTRWDCYNLFPWACIYLREHILAGCFDVGKSKSLS